MGNDIRTELDGFRRLAGFLEGIGLSEERAEVWARAAAARYRHALRRGANPGAVFDRDAAQRYADLEKQGASPRSWL